MHWLDLDRAILPDERRWGQGYGDRPYTDAELAEIIKSVTETKQPGYGRRYVEPDSSVYVRGDRLEMPSGHDAIGHPNRESMASDVLDPDLPTVQTRPWQMPEAVQEFFRTRGWRLDQHGRPCMPRAEQLIAHPHIGLNTGVGFSYYLGENVVVDVVLLLGERVLLVDRTTDAGVIPSLPGGYSTPASYALLPEDWASGNRPVTMEGIMATARRKMLAEAAVVLPPDARMEIVRGIRPVSSPHTLNFWTVTYTVRCDLGKGGESLMTAPTVQIVGLHKLEAILPRMWPDHRRALLAAIG
jgi:hypothetical protein